MDGVLQRPWTGYLHMVNTRTQPDIPDVSLRIAYSSFVDGTRVLSLDSITDAMPSVAPSCTCAWREMSSVCRRLLVTFQAGGETAGLYVTQESLQPPHIVPCCDT